MTEPQTQTNDLILPTSNILFETAQAVAEITNPLKTLGVTTFSYTRSYKDGSMIDISNNPRMLELFYYQSDAYKFYAPDTNPAAFTESFCRYFQGVSAKENEVLNLLKYDLNADYILCYARKHKNYYETFNFSVPLGDWASFQFLEGNKDLLTAYSCFFKDKAYALIKACERDKIKRPPSAFTDTTTYDDCQKRSIFLKEIKTKRYYIGDNYPNTYLTHQECLCLLWCARGKSIAETGIILGLSPRTIETHMRNAKEKLNIYKTSELITTITKSGVLDCINIH